VVVSGPGHINGGEDDAGEDGDEDGESGVLFSEESNGTLK